VKLSALEELVSPETLEPLTISVIEERDGEIWTASLGRGEMEYSVRCGIPSFVSGDVQADQTVRSFGDKWDLHRYYRKHTERFYTDWYLQRHNLDRADGLKTLLAGKKRILDAGTGAGRDAANFAAHASAESVVFGVDTAWHALQNAVQMGELGNVQLVHADVNRLPFRDDYFDFINCDQVIHHTPNPPLAFENLARKLKRGGEITTYVYARKSAIREFTDDYVRDRIKNESFARALEVCDGITKLGRALAGLHATVEVEEDIPILGITKGTYDVQRFFHWNVMKCFWNDDFDFFTNNVVNADWYHPIHCFRYTPEEFRSWFRSGWEILSWDVQEAGISCRARKS
jgi:ubiquinone/menaquinone biosynthesis C-methylase UbiE